MAKKKRRANTPVEEQTDKEEDYVAESVLEAGLVEAVKAQARELAKDGYAVEDVRVGMVMTAGNKCVVPVKFVMGKPKDGDRGRKG